MKSITEQLLVYGFSYMGKCGVCQGAPEKWRLLDYHSIEFKVKPRYNSFRLFFDEREVMSGNNTNVEDAIKLIKLQKPDAKIIYPQPTI